MDIELPIIENDELPVLDEIGEILETNELPNSTAQLIMNWPSMSADSIRHNIEKARQIF